MNDNRYHDSFILLDTLFHRVVNKMKRIEQKPRYFGTPYLLYPSEIHTIESVGRHPGINVTGLADLQGVTKGAVSQVIRKLVDKNMVIRMKDEQNDRDVLLKLSDTGRVAYDAHEEFHARIYPELTTVLDEADEKTMAFVEKLFKSMDKFCDSVLNEPESPPPSP
ncbi:MAG: MarR family transcriptional regulator [Desulfobacter sp.]|nr:MAG: MarR family transcriptional regulator [Desulfobacter sp.]